MTQEFEGHTLKRFDSELGHIHMRAIEMGGLAVNQVLLALEAFEAKDLSTAHHIISKDHKVDHLERITDEEITSIIARRSPVAGDLRLLLSVAKMMTNLERVGDGAVKIAHITLELYEHPAFNPADEMFREIIHAGYKAVDMFKLALEAFDRLDEQKARQVLDQDWDFELDFQSTLRKCSTYVIEDPRTVGHLIKATLLLKALERIGDHAQNIAEYIVYIVKGIDIRHPEADKSSAGS